MISVILAYKPYAPSEARRSYEYTDKYSAKQEWKKKKNRTKQKIARIRSDEDDSFLSQDIDNT